MKSLYKCFSLIADSQFDEGWVGHALVSEHGKENTNRIEIMASQLPFLINSLCKQCYPLFTENPYEQ